eukprot:m.41049 g.41049  ORF g.41049 m.41049 type:complete len:151 (-) comp5649_c0_seq1:2332-2784(-)
MFTFPLMLRCDHCGAYAEVRPEGSEDALHGAEFTCALAGHACSSTKMKARAAEPPMRPAKRAAKESSAVIQDAEPPSTPERTQIWPVIPVGSAVMVQYGKTAYSAIVMDIDEKTNQCLVKYLGTTSDRNEWRPVAELTSVDAFSSRKRGR